MDLALLTVRILVVNAGSSSLKVSVVRDGVAVASYDALPGVAPDVDAVGHRVVHGGPDLVAPVLVDAAIEARLRELVELAPLHQPVSLAALDAARRLLPDVPHVACFDTAFHTTLPPAAYTVALPRAWRERWALRRYGFHGLSHAWAARRAAAMNPAGRRVVSCHLGAGASVTAILDGRSVDTTMGFTPLDGLVMATRSGSVDPGLLLWVQERAGIGPAAMADALEHDSGLRGLTGTADMRALMTREDADAVLALEVYVHHLVAGIAAMAAAAGGLDTLVFTGGVGEHDAEIRRRTTSRLGHLGVVIDDDGNATAHPDVDIGAPGCAVRTLVVTAREDLEIARGVAGVLTAVPA